MSSNRDTIQNFATGLADSNFTSEIRFFFLDLHKNLRLRNFSFSERLDSVLTQCQMMNFLLLILYLSERGKRHLEVHLTVAEFLC